MSNYFLKEISIEGFRGINNENSPLILKFNREGVTSFFAENGQGKSSIYEAIFYCINDSFPKIDKLHRELQDYTTIKNLFHSGNGQIKLVFTDDSNNNVSIDYLIDTNNKAVSSSDISNPDEFLKKLRDVHNFLDYETFTGIIKESPEDAGKTFSALIGYSKFTNIKDKLEKVSRTQNINTDFDKKNKENKITSIKEAIYNKQVEIISILNNQNIKYKRYNKSIIENRILKELKNTFDFIEEENIYNIEYDNLLSKLLGPNYNENINKQSELLNQIKAYSDRLKLLKTIKKTSFSKLNTSLKNAYKKLEDVRDLYLGSLYEKAIDTYSLLPDLDKNTCILCRTQDLGNSKNTFVDILKTKITKYEKFKSELDSVRKGLLTLIEDFSLVELENILLDKNSISSDFMVFSNFKSSNNQELSKDYFDNSNLFERIRQYIIYISEELKSVKHEYIEISKKIPKNITTLNEKISSFKSIKNELINIDEDSSEILKIKRELEKIDKWVNYINTVKQNYDNAYNILMEQIASDINEDAKKFFQEIMVNNEIIPILEKKSTGQKINLMLEKFYSTSNKKAANLLSESYRNALCLSIYFATALRNISSSKFIVLDDITSSFDSGHQIKLIEVIEKQIAKANRNKRKQVILFTHDGELKKVLNNMDLQKNKWVHHKIIRTLDGSITSLRKIETDYLKSELETKLNSGDTDVGSKLREYFEKTIFEIIESLNIPIPFKDIYDTEASKLENLINSIEKQISLERNFRSQRVVIPNFSSTYIRNIKDIANKVSHFNTNSRTSYTPQILLSFVNDIFDFKRQFMYECICHLNQGWVFFSSITKKKKNNRCNC